MEELNTNNFMSAEKANETQDKTNPVPDVRETENPFVASKVLLCLYSV